VNESSSVSQFDSEPLLLIAFNRPDHLERLIDRLKETQPTRIFLAVDGPRAGHPTDSDRVARTRALVSHIDWPCEVRTLFQESNLGCGEGVSAAISWFFSQVERGIILEDDILPQSSLFGFCSELLQTYENDSRVLAISGCNFVPPEELEFDAPYRFSRVPHIWGWATWKRAWALHDLNIEGWRTALPERRLLRQMGYSPAGFLYWRTNFDMMARHAIDTWDFQLVFAGMANQALTATSNVNLVDNIGWGEESTHTADKPTYLRQSEQIHLPVGTLPVRVDEKADSWSRKNVFGASTLGLMKQAVRYVKRRKSG
jgi:hypothetical protein